MVGEVEAKRTRKATTLQKVHLITTLSDVESTVANWVNVAVVIIQMIKQRKPIVYQVILELFNFCISNEVQKWQNEQSYAQPQVAFIFVRGFDSVLTACAKAAQNYQTLTAIKDADMSKIKIRFYENIWHVYEDFQQDIRRHIRARSPCLEVPIFTPVEFTLEYHREQKRVKVESIAAYQQAAPFKPSDSFAGGAGRFGGGGRFGGRSGRGAPTLGGRFDGGRFGGRGGRFDGGDTGRGSRFGGGGRFSQNYDPEYSKRLGSVYIANNVKIPQNIAEVT